MAKCLISLAQGQLFFIVRGGKLLATCLLAGFLLNLFFFDPED
jgi:hypothetical protein